jgi:hypothetical protein
MNDEQKGHQGQRISYVDGELCVVCVSARAGGVSGPPTDDDALERNYRQVAERLNGAIGGLLKLRQRRSACRNSLDQDLQPVGLLRCLKPRASRITWLQPVDQAVGGRIWEKDWRPSILLRPPRGERRARAALLHFYKLGVEPRFTGANDNDDLNVRELCNLINWDFRRDADQESVVGGWVIAAASPNWLTAAAQSGHSVGSPGCRPEPAPGKSWSFHFERADLEALVAGARVLSEREPNAPSRVVVAVLDASPTKAQVDAAAGKNDLLAKVASRVKIDDGALGVAGGYLGGVTVGWNGEAGASAFASATADDFRIADHGLFAAGVIQDIAPTAEIRLIRVLNDFGVGDLRALADVLSRLPVALGVEQGKRLVVNLSLGAELPSGKELLEWWLPSTAKELARQPRTAAALEQNLERTLGRVRGEALDVLRLTHEALRQAIAFLQGQGVLVVAAAGNDHNPFASGRFLPEPRWPARYDQVLGVGAVNAATTPAEFSNRGDVESLVNGVAVYGGQAKRPTASDPPRIDLTPAANGGQVDAVAGIYSAETFAMHQNDPQKNDSGWAYWSGTSFATPVISAIAADIWAESPGLSPWQVMEKVRLGLADSLGPATDPDGPLDCPTVRAFQHHVP